jgi:hypothetical protein
MALPFLFRFSKCPLIKLATVNGGHLFPVLRVFTLKVDVVIGLAFPVFSDGGILGSPTIRAI